MNVKISKRHYRKYRRIAKLLGYSLANADTVLGLTREQMAAKVQEDPHLNNCGPLRNWDILGSWMWGRKHTLNVDGEDDGVKRGMSKAEAVCTVKHAVVFQFVGATPEFESHTPRCYTADPMCKQRHHHHNGEFCEACQGWA